MPLRDPKKYLYDIANCREFLLTIRQGKTVKDYRNDRLFRSAVERELQIIGEALLQLEKVSPARAEKMSEHRGIIAFRNVLVHGYDSLDPETVWNVVETKLAVLLGEAQRALRE